MNPGATTRPAASIVRLPAAPLCFPTPTIFPPCTATSAWNDGSPEPSTTRPFLMSRSYAMMRSPHCPAPNEPGTVAAGRLTGPVVHRHLWWCKKSLRLNGEGSNNFSRLEKCKLEYKSNNEEHAL